MSDQDRQWSAPGAAPSTAGETDSPPSQPSRPEPLTAPGATEPHSPEPSAPPVSPPAADFPPLPAAQASPPAADFPPPAATDFPSPSAASAATDFPSQPTVSAAADSPTLPVSPAGGGFSTFAAAPASPAGGAPAASPVWGDVSPAVPAAAPVSGGSGAVADSVPASGIPASGVPASGIPASGLPWAAPAGHTNGHTHGHAGGHTAQYPSVPSQPMSGPAYPSGVPQASTGPGTTATLPGAGSTAAFPPVQTSPAYQTGRVGLGVPPSGGPATNVFGQPVTSGPPGSPAAFGQPGQSGQPGHHGQPGQYGQPGQFERPGQFGQPGVPGPLGQPGPLGNTGQFGQAGPFGPTGQFGQVPPPGVPGQPGYPQPRPSRAGRILAIVAAALALSLVSAVGGGVVATELAGDRAGTSTVVNNNPAPNLDRSSVGAVAEKVLPSVVDISTGEAEGSGVIMTGDGEIITNNHVVQGASKLTVTFSNGKTAPATVVGTDPAGDIAVIKAQGVSGLSAAKFGDSDALRVGDTVLAVGSPLGLQGSVTAGIVSALHRTISSGEQGAKSIADAIQTDAAINPGNSGGALVNLAGEVVGINTAIATAGENSGNIGVGFAISANRARSAADQLAKGGKVSHPYLGVQLADGAGGALVGGVVAGGPADKAGIKNGDLVTKVGSTPIDDATDLINAVQAAKVGDQLKVTVQRNSTEQTITVTLGESP
ncbi:trypsin-like peptidase domain-containing protein [Dactylosporangium sp. AC04546]|uniref:S1C family serine protease n=1 Tax=Dactylosporangium sp. AC04546 TaxID=2862460 RepID=UPI001EE0573A|nr:trypsin-like peptidase domain-containing protein [Dactylosporangium sp. AC04546]WVK86165.1 trypsin-like peptidase domain-containing protein [Dactylosporangium sp. AC04546]